MKTQKLKNGIKVIALIEDEKVTATVSKLKGIMVEVETEDGELVNVHHTKVTRVRKETCMRLNFEKRSAKLSDEEVRELRAEWGTMSRKAIAEKYGISTSYAYKLATQRAAKAVRGEVA